MSGPLEDGSHHLARAPEGTFASSAGLRERVAARVAELEAQRERLIQVLEEACYFLRVEGYRNGTGSDGAFLDRADKAIQLARGGQ